jgi:alkylation response protein AidB-like acyl-CoA dehydrogenase
MPETLQTTQPTPLTTLTEDEILFRDNIRQFADEKIRPHVKEMDEKGVFEKELLHDFFQLGLMGIEIPEQYGGGGGKFFEAILAVEEFSRVDASSLWMCRIRSSTTPFCAGGMKSRRSATCPEWPPKSWAPTP